MHQQSLVVSSTAVIPTCFPRRCRAPSSLTLRQCRALDRPGQRPGVAGVGLLAGARRQHGTVRTEGSGARSIAGGSEKQRPAKMRRRGVGGESRTDSPPGSGRSRSVETDRPDWASARTLVAAVEGRSPLSSGVESSARPRKSTSTMESNSASEMIPSRSLWCSTPDTRGARRRAPAAGVSSAPPLPPPVRGCTPPGDGVRVPSHTSAAGVDSGKLAPLRPHPLRSGARRCFRTRIGLPAYPSSASTPPSSAHAGRARDVVAFAQCPGACPASPFWGQGAMPCSIGRAGAPAHPNGEEPGKPALGILKTEGPH